MVRLVLPKAVYVETIEVATRRLKVVGNFSALDYAASSVKKKKDYAASPPPPPAISPVSPNSP
jgi:hypothetical protein